MRMIFDKICCFIVRIWLVPRAEGTDVPVPSPLLTLINRHLDHCGLCRIELKNLRIISFALHRVGRTTMHKTLDSSFADRVINRVRKSEVQRLRRKAQTHALLAAASGATVFVVAISLLGWLNALQAQRSTLSTSIEPIIKPSAAPPPFNDHDPFSTNTLTPTAQALTPMVAAVAPTVAVQYDTQRTKLPPIPDHLTRLNISPAFQVKSDTEKPAVSRLPQEQPVLAEATVHTLQQTAAPVIMTSDGASNGPELETAAASDAASAVPMTAPTSNIQQPGYSYQAPTVRPVAAAPSPSAPAAATTEQDSQSAAADQSR